MKYYKRKGTSSFTIRLQRKTFFFFFFFWYSSFWWEMSIFTRGFTCIRRRFQAGGFWILKLGWRGPQGHTAQITLAAPGASWLFNSGSALLRLKCLFTLEVSIAHICLYIHKMDYVNQGDLVCFLSQHRRGLILGAHTWRTRSKWTGEDPLCWLCRGAGSQPETSGNCWVFQDCRVISMASSMPCFLTLTATATSESSLSPPLLTYVL